MSASLASKRERIRNQNGLLAAGELTNEGISHVFRDWMVKWVNEGLAERVEWASFFLEECV